MRKSIDQSGDSRKHCGRRKGTTAQTPRFRAKYMLVPAFLLCILPLIQGGKAAAQVETLFQWNFDRDGQRENWTGTNHLKEIQVKEGIFRAVASGNDPFFSAEGFEVATTPTQAVEFRYRTNRKGGGQLFFTNTSEGYYGGIDPKKFAAWNTVGDEQWHTVRIFPNWNSEKKIVKLRLDFPNLQPEEVGRVFYEIDWIRIVDLNFATAPKTTPDWVFTRIKKGWNPLDLGIAEPGPDGWKISGTIETDPLTLDIDESGAVWVSIQMAVDRGKAATLSFCSDAGAFRSIHFPVVADGKDRWYNVDVLSDAGWKGKIHLLQLTVSDDPGATATLKRLIASENPQGPADIVVLQTYQPDAINRAGNPSQIAVRLQNSGGTTARGLKLEPFDIAATLGNVKASEPLDLEPLEMKTVTIDLTAEKPFQGKIKFRLTGKDLPEETVETTVKFEESLHLPKADYVPKPQPVESDYEIGALYFPGWSKRQAWDRVADTHPERRPVLGWYDEANPEVIDWQIKWSLENGIRYYLVDWYWHKGGQHHDHWVKGFQKARYKSMFRWAMMWANHNPQGSHSEEDQRNVTRFWIDNYFNTPEYYTIDGRPVVMIWSPQNMDRDIATIEKEKGNTLKRGEGLKRLLDLSQEMAREAGYKGIFFVAMKWPEASTRPEEIQWLADAGFEMTSIYHFMHHGGKAANPRRFPFELVVEASLPFWEDRHKTGILPFFPNLSTGWDSRPWHGERQTVIYDRTVEGFRRICQDYKRFAEKTGIKRMLLAPTNEWGEGSYAEPNAEYGFGMFETVRDTFCKKPAQGWPLNYAPGDVGLGPYDLPPLSKIQRTSWNFQDGAQGWTPLMGIGNFKAGDGKIAFETTTRDPAVHTTLHRVDAAPFQRLVVRMKVTSDTVKKDKAQLFWSTATSPVSETNSLSVPIEVDGEFHDYRFDLESKRNWRRRITSFRFDPATSADLKIVIESIRLEPDGPSQ